MKRKGFTLVELLGVIIVLGIIAMIIVPTINSSLKKHRNNLCKVQYENILLAAKAYGADYLMEINDGDIITLDILQENGYISKNINNPKKQDEKITKADVVVVKIGNKISYRFKDAIDCLGNSSYNVANRYVSDGLIFMYDVSSKPISSGSDFIWEDLSGNGNDVTLKNFSSDISSWYSNDGILFDGVDDYGLIGEHNYNNITISAIVETKDMADNYNDIIGNMQSGGYGLYYNNDRKFYSGLYIGTQVYRNISNVGENNIKYHLTSVYDGNNMYLYINGKMVSSLAASGEIALPESNTSLMLGADPNGQEAVSEYANMLLSNVIFYNRALTEEEIMQNYQVDVNRFGI